MPRETRTRQGRIPSTGDPHRGEDPAEDPPPEGRATQGTHTEHTKTFVLYAVYALYSIYKHTAPPQTLLGSGYLYRIG